MIRKKEKKINELKNKCDGQKVKRADGCGPAPQWSAGGPGGWDVVDSTRPSDKEPRETVQNSGG